jgi:hypothetical protein
MVVMKMNDKFLNYIKENGTTDISNGISEVHSDDIRNKLIHNIEMAEQDINDITPGQPFDSIKDEQSLAELKEKASLELLSTVATNKVKEQQALEKKRPMEERIKDYFIKASISSSKTYYLEKNGFVMSGQQERKLRRQLEHNYGKPGYKPTPEQREQIIAYLNMPSSEKQNAQETHRNNRSTSQSINSLMSMI